MRKVRWGVLSTARIGTEKVIPAIQGSEHGVVTAISSRDMESARAAASKLGIEKAYGSYGELLADPEIDAVYNPLPNHLHVPWSVRAMEAGKHVLCEKPLGLDAEDAEKLRAEAKRHPELKVMEGFMYRFHPQWVRAFDLVRGGSIGDVRSLTSAFSYFNDDPRNVRNRADIGGGGLMDVGCYNISMSRWIFGAEPKRVCGVLDIDPRFGVDRLASCILEFDAGTSVFTCATQLAWHQRVNILGTKGRVEIEVPFNPALGGPARLWHQRDAVVEEILTEPANQFTLQADAFALAVLDDTPVPTPLEDAVANMRVIDAVFASAHNDRWVDLS
jgi:predicted dehydrogenase